MKYIIICLLLASCAEVPLQDNPYQRQAVVDFARYNFAHHLNLAVPQVYLGPTEGPYAGETVCGHRCFIVINPSRSIDMNQTLIHEEAHAVCVETVPDCRVMSHDKAWQSIALELGLNPNDSYVHS